MIKKLRNWEMVEFENKLYEKILNEAGWSIVRMPDVATVYLSHKYTGRIVELEFEQFEGMTGLDIFDEFMTKKKTQ